MKIALQDGRRYVLRFDKDEEVMEGLTKFMQENQVTACTFQGIGTCSLVELGFFNSHLKQYRQKPFAEDLEIVSLIGTGSILAPDNKPAIHAHGSFSRTDFTMTAGHVFKLVALATCEIFLIKLEGTLSRANNPDFNLNLLT